MLLDSHWAVISTYISSRKIDKEFVNKSIDLTGRVQQIVNEIYNTIDIYSNLFISSIHKFHKYYHIKLSNNTIANNSQYFRINRLIIFYVQQFYTF
jgi:hypothetical protein